MSNAQTQQIPMIVCSSRPHLALANIVMKAKSDDSNNLTYDLTDNIHSVDEISNPNCGVSNWRHLTVLIISECC